MVNKDFQKATRKSPNQACIHKPSYKFVLIFLSLKYEFMHVCFHEFNEIFNSLTSKMPLLLIYATETIILLSTYWTQIKRSLCLYFLYIW